MGAAKQIEQRLAIPTDEAERAAAAVGRKLVLDVYNPWVAWARWAEKFHDPKALSRPWVIRSHKAFRPFPRGLAFRLQNL